MAFSDALQVKTGKTQLCSKMIHPDCQICSAMYNQVKFGHSQVYVAPNLIIEMLLNARSSSSQARACLMSRTPCRRAVLRLRCHSVLLWPNWRIICLKTQTSFHSQLRSVWIIIGIMSIHNKRFLRVWLIQNPNCQKWSWDWRPYRKLRVWLPKALPKLKQRRSLCQRSRPSGSHSSLRSSQTLSRWPCKRYKTYRAYLMALFCNLWQFLVFHSKLLKLKQWLWPIMENLGLKSKLRWSARCARLSTWPNRSIRV